MPRDNGRLTAADSVAAAERRLAELQAECDALGNAYAKALERASVDPARPVRDIVDAGRKGITNPYELAVAAHPFVKGAKERQQRLQTKKWAERLLKQNAAEERQVRNRRNATIDETDRPMRRHCYALRIDPDFTGQDLQNFQAYMTGSARVKPKGLKSLVEDSITVIRSDKEEDLLFIVVCIFEDSCTGAGEIEGWIRVQAGKKGLQCLSVAQADEQGAKFFSDEDGYEDRNRRSLTGSSAGTMEDHAPGDF